MATEKKQIEDGVKRVAEAARALPALLPQLEAMAKQAEAGLMEMLHKEVPENPTKANQHRQKVSKLRYAAKMYGATLQLVLVLRQMDAEQKRFNNK